MNFFFDRCMSPRLCRMVAILEEGKHTLTHHDIRFAQDTTDVAWITELSHDEEKPIVITGDFRILKKPDEVAALKQSGLTFFCLSGNWVSLPIHEMAWKFLKAWPDIVKSANVSNPTVFEVCAGRGFKVEKYALTKDARR